MIQKRIISEINEINSSPKTQARFINDDFLQWEVKIVGPENSPYKDGIFSLKIIFPITYPFNSPKITFITPIYHPNIDSNGNICLGTLNSHWSPLCTISKSILLIMLILENPDPENPLMPDIAQLFKTNKSMYFELAKELTKTYAI
uniref:UBC core domain-containing protein n=1 Tax=viral metagenome TaxID=1070528 RepID=A0A6C0J8E1_9ZZZZ